MESQVTAWNPPFIEKGPAMQMLAEHGKWWYKEHKDKAGFVPRAPIVSVLTRLLQEFGLGSITVGQYRNRILPDFFIEGAEPYPSL